MRLFRISLTKGRQFLDDIVHILQNTQVRYLESICYIVFIMASDIEMHSLEYNQMIRLCKLPTGVE